jgi:hypothetical protein
MMQPYSKRVIRRVVIFATVAVAVSVVYFVNPHQFHGRMTMQGATERDFKDGTAIFYVKDGRSTRYDLGHSLPAAGIVRKAMQFSDGKTISAGTPVTIVQAEITDDRDVLIGFRYGKEQGICKLSEVTLSP